ncbi:MAG TPA: DUF3298 domain-containing protein, partial [Saprospiraceae bacterium]|nr:DUF3298 domain-containing protein [Saprospiraceae bacterium]
LLFSCQQDKPAPPSATPPLSVSEAKLKTQDCVHDSVCAEVSLVFVQLAGGPNAAATAAINDSLRSLAMSALEVEPKLALEAGFDTSAKRLFADLKEHVLIAPDWSGSYERNISVKSVWSNPRFASFEAAMYSFTGGAHGNHANELRTYDLSTGKSVPLSDVVRDTAALVPMLEKAFVESKQQDEQASLTLAELLYEGTKHLPVSTNFCLTEQGLRFFYNPYEVAPWVVGDTDITLTWEQLGALADRGKWK